ncbi:MAG: Ig-like domain-containing protein [Oscillospiraceae bacterium]|nr:Ig-like domain-containing protein [Oscillospiraceae bacterium]
MNTIRRLTSLLLAVCMLVTFLPTEVFSANAATGDSYVYAFAEGVRIHSANNPTTDDAGTLSYPQINFTGSNHNFEILQYYSGSTPEYVSLWRFVRSLTTASQVIHYGHNHKDGLTDYGIFLFNGDAKGATATFEIRVPEDGTYTFDIAYVDYADARDVNVYLTSSSGGAAPTNAKCLLTTITPTKGSFTDATHSVTGVSIPKGDYYITFETATDYVKPTSPARYFPLKTLTLTKTAEATPVTAYKVAIGRENHNVLAVGETVQLTSKVWPQNKVEGYTNQTLTWASSNTNVATVDEAGLVTAIGNGTALITGTSQLGGRVETVSVAVGDSKSMLYAINEDAKKYMEANFGSTTVLKIHEQFVDTYAYSTFDQWCYTKDVANRDVTAYTSNHTAPVNSKYGAFLWYSTTNNAVTFKINVENDGNYIPEVSYLSGSGSKTADVYIYPVKYKDTLVPSECKALALSRNDGDKLISTAGNSVSLRKGEYYVTINSTSTDGTYVYLHHIALLYQGAYNNSTAVGEIILTNTCPKIPANTIDYYQVGLKVFPKNADQFATWKAARDGAVVSANQDGWLTGDHDDKGSTVISVTVGGKEQVTSASTGALLYAFSNVGKAAIAGAAETSYTLDQIDDYSKVTSGDPWAFVEQSDPTQTLPIVYQGHKDNDKFGMFLTFSTGDDSDYVRFKIHVDKTNNYIPEILYRDYGTHNLRMTDVYLAPVNATNSFDTRIMRVRPYSGNTGNDRGVQLQQGQSYYIPAGDYYLSFRPTPSAENDIAENVAKARYLTMYHFALVEDSENLNAASPKAVIITKEHTNPLTTSGEGSTLQLSARVIPTWASQAVTWKSYNETVATVDADTGLVTAKGEGVALITATTKSDARSEAVIVQVGNNSNVYAFNEVIVKYLEQKNITSVKLSNDSTFSDANYLWKNYCNVGNSWRWLGGTNSADSVYTGDSKKDDAPGDDSDPNFKYGLFLMSNSKNSQARFEIEVTEDGEYTAEILQYMAKNNEDTKQSSRAVEIYISPITTPVEDLTHEAHYVGTTVLKDHGNNASWSYGIDSQSFSGVQLKAGKYNLVFKAPDEIGRYLYLHAFALHRAGDFVQPTPKEVLITATPDEVVFMDANATIDLDAMVLSLLADQNVVWTSDNPAVATVDANGVVTAKATEGTALITVTSAVNSEVKDKVRIIIGKKATPAFKFDFQGAVSKLFPTTNNTNDYINLFTDTDFDVNYDLSIANGSAPWMLLSTTDPNQYCSYTYSSHTGYGLFVMSSKTVNETVKLKVKVGKDATYGVVLNITDYPKSNDFEVYLAPANATDPMAERWYVATHRITRRTTMYYGLDLGELPLYAGEYILSIKSLKANDTGLISVHNLSLYRTDDIYYTLEGAQVRIEGQNAFGTFENQGIRFISTIYKSEFNVDSADVKEFGTVLFPKDFLNEGDDGADLTVNYVGLNGATAARVPAKNRYLDTGDAVTFTAVLTGLKDTNYKRAFVARAYVILNDGTVLYGDTWTERSIYDVAKNGLDREASGEVTMSDKEKSALTAIVNTAK